MRHFSFTKFINIKFLHNPQICSRSCLCDAQISLKVDWNWSLWAPQCKVGFSVGVGRKPRCSPLPWMFFQLPVPNEPPLTHFQHFPPEWVSWQRASEEAKACWTRTVGQRQAEKKATTAPGKMDQYFSKEDVVTAGAASAVGAKGVASTGGAVLKKSLFTIGGHILVLMLVHHWSTLASSAHSLSAIEGGSICHQLSQESESAAAMTRGSCGSVESALTALYYT